ncbi:hypothetical protein HWV62_39647 [Athelia sp. TMB]|nr:hypothetical protein HWV62_39647 [Athelia sp. TMB]
MENDSTFVAPEGVYSVTEEYKPAPSLIHPITPSNPVHPTRLSHITVRFPLHKPAGAAPGFAQLLAKKPSPADREKDAVSHTSSDTPDEEPAESVAEPSLFGGRKGLKAPPRPKHNIRTTSSTFIARLQSAEGLAKTLAGKHGDTTFLFYNSAKSLIWVDVGSGSGSGAGAKEPLARLTFTAFPTCHDVHPATGSPERLDVIIGFATGDLLWFCPLSSRYARLNKAGCVSASPVTAVRWVPSSASLFLAAHADGSVLIYDTEREDAPFAPPEPPAHWNPLETIHVSAPPFPQTKAPAKNPVSHWRVTRGTKAVVDMVFSPDAGHLALISEDGCLRVVDALSGALVDCFASYFGALGCLAWSPDGRFILTGGQDDLLTLFAPWEARVVARAQGHSSFVVGAAFDPQRCDGRTYRFGSVGDDGKLILWDFSSGALHRPKSHTAHSHGSQSAAAHRFSVASTASLRGLPPPAWSSLGEKDGREGGRFHPAPGRNEVAVVQPVLVKNTGAELATGIAFLPRALLTAGKTGLVKMWVRPLAIRAKRGSVHS